MNRDIDWTAVLVTLLIVVALIAMVSVGLTYESSKMAFRNRCVETIKDKPAAEIAVVCLPKL